MFIEICGSIFFIVLVLTSASDVYASILMPTLDSVPLVSAGEKILAFIIIYVAIKFIIKIFYQAVDDAKDYVSYESTLHITEADHGESEVDSYDTGRTDYNAQIPDDF
jgi:hypothetical protein